MANILVFAEFANSKVKKGALELLSAARGTGHDVKVFAFGAGADKIAEQLKGWGVKELIACADEKLNQYNPELFAKVASDIIAAEKPFLVLASSSMLARDLFPRVASQTNSGIASDCTELKISGTNTEVRKPLYSGKCSAAVEFQNCDTRIVLMRANQLPVGAPDSSAAPAVKTVALPPVDLKTKIKEIVKGASEKLDLTEANIIVAGGRGMKGPEHFKLLEELAAVLNATVGASRAVVDAGWVPHGMQVGQTGKTVAPTLYIACGISGAIQHLAGMSGSKVIVAVNKDPDAPIFQRATYGIVGDVFEVIPQLTEEFKKLVHH
jgi:electron transfer flavoprotein alpha subunit